MHGLPNQSIEDGLYDISEAVKMSPTHLSWYQLTIEPNTLFAAKTPILPNEDVLEQIEIRGKEIMRNAGYKQYEISAYAKDGKVSRHNTNYWFFGDYIGTGAGAHSKVTNLKTNEIKRTWKHKHPKIYTQADKLIHGTSIITNNDLIYEFMINALRIKNGFDKQTFERHTFLNYSMIENNVNLGVEKGLLILDGEQIKPTDKGYLFLNDCINLFV